ncbi:MAG: ABC transporter substrate-binding protein, partial [Burkholderiales bacterium]|nr:ABC transporter substrate-binding protein [Burkholderiales bacterium]
ARRTTTTIPIVMSGVDDPVGRGLIASLARPGGNVTGLASTAREMNEKLLSLVRDLLPQASSVAVLYDTNDVDGSSILKKIQSAAKSAGLGVLPAAAQRPADVEPAIAAARKQGVQVLLVLPSSMLIPNWVADLALRNRLPMVSTAAGYAFDGGLLAYTDDRNAVFDRVAFFVDRILKGAKPADMPVELPAKFRLILNDRTAQSLGLPIPKSIELVAERIQ